jgi:hypothetical protein
MRRSVFVGHGPQVDQALFRNADRSPELLGQVGCIEVRDVGGVHHEPLVTQQRLGVLMPGDCPDGPHPGSRQPRQRPLLTNPPVRRQRVAEHFGVHQIDLRNLGPLVWTVDHSFSSDVVNIQMVLSSEW